ncbi:unnamed protein product [Dicrocoelium dendriticum]|nr:unnamed protein product [Dicrocoelium dendriticum]
MTTIVAVCDRTGEFRVCAKSFQQRVISDRCVLKPRRSSGACGRRTNVLTMEYFKLAKAIASDLSMTETKLRNLRILLEQSCLASSSSIAQLTDTIQSDVSGLNHYLCNLRLLECKARDQYASSTQVPKHNSLIAKGLGYVLAISLSSFQKTLESNKDKISATT